MAVCPCYEVLAFPPVQFYNYRGVSKYHFPMYLKEVEFRFNHRTDNLLKLLTQIYFGYVSV